MKNILITGGAGFIGAYLTRFLVSQGHSIIVVDNFLRGVPERLNCIKDKILIVNLDLRYDFDELVKISLDVDCVFHLAAINGTENFYKHSDLVLDVGVFGILNVLNAVEKNKIDKLIVASSAEVYQTSLTIPTPETVPLIVPDPFEPRYSYASSKIISEQLSLAYVRAERRNNVIIFRPHNVYGPDMGNKHVIPQFINRAIEIRNQGFKKPFEIYGTGQETRAFCFVEDIVNGLDILLDDGKNGEIYNIGSNEELKIIEVFQIINSHFSNKLEPKFLSAAQGSTSRRCPDISKIENLGYQANINMNEGLCETIIAYDSLENKNSYNKLI